MRISTRGEYGLLALVELAMSARQGPVQAQQIARKQGIPKQYLDQLMLALRKAGFVESVRGRQGGYALARSPKEITLLDVVSAMEGPVVNMNFLPTKERRKLVARAVLKRTWDELALENSAALAKKTLEEICNACAAEEQVPMYYI
jgi:Rrf2 family protein